MGFAVPPSSGLPRTLAKARSAAKNLNARKIFFRRSEFFYDAAIMSALPSRRSCEVAMAEANEAITEILLAWGDGDEAALERLMPIVYAELRRLAHHYM